MNKIIKVIIIVFFIAAVILLAASYANGASLDYSKVIKDANNSLKAYQQGQVPVINNAIDHSINNTMQLCATLFDTGLNSKYSILCDKVMITLDKLCRDNYYTFCFGQAWVNYELPEHKNPPFCKSKMNTSGVDC